MPINDNDNIVFGLDAPCKAIEFLTTDEEIIEIVFSSSEIAFVVIPEERLH